MRVTPSVFDFIGDLDEGNDCEEEFKYIGLLVNTEALREMSEFKRAEAERKNLLLEHYYAQISSEEI